MRVRVHQVMTVVKGLVKNGITICATIHSPTPYSFNLFHTLMILLRGKVVYFGENGATPYSYIYNPLFLAKGGEVRTHVTAALFIPLIELAGSQAKRGHIITRRRKSRLIEP